MKNNNYKKMGAVLLILTMFIVSISNGTIAGITDSISSLEKSNDSTDEDTTIDLEEIQLKSMKYQISSNNFTYYQDKYAVIIVGDPGDPQHYKWFTNDAQRQYNVLKQKYGFLPGKIFVLITLKEGTKWQENLSCDPDIIDMDAIEKNIKNLFREFRAYGLYEIDNKDLLYVVIISHGLDIGTFYGSKIGIGDLWPNGHDTYFGLEDEIDEEALQTNEELESIKKEAAQYLNENALEEFENNKISSLNFNSNCSVLSPTKLFDWEFALYSSNINAKRIVFMLQPCFSGGFIRELSGNNRVILTASRENELALAPFIGFVYYGLNGSADLNYDNKITIAEVFEYTSTGVRNYLNNHPEERPQHPLIDDNGDGIGKLDQNTGYNPNKQGYDGHIAARIFNFEYEESNLLTIQNSQQISLIYQQKLN